MRVTMPGHRILLEYGVFDPIWDRKQTFLIRHQNDYTIVMGDSVWLVEVNTDDTVTGRSVHCFVGRVVPVDKVIATCSPGWTVLSLHSVVKYQKINVDEVGLHNDIVR